MKMVLLSSFHFSVQLDIEYYVFYQIFFIKYFLPSIFPWKYFYSRFSKVLKVNILL